MIREAMNNIANLYIDICFLSRKSIPHNTTAMIYRVYAYAITRANA